MKTLRSLLAISMIIGMISACSTGNKTELFNGKDLENWSVYLPEGVPHDSVFRVENQMIYVAGIPNGYLRTKEEYSNYKLHVEWRWVAEPKNSGVLLHVTGDDLVWPNCIEAQLMTGNAGDFVLIGKGAGLTVNDSTYLVESEENRYMVVKKMEESTEKTAGEWNSYDIIVNEDKIELYVNEVLQNRATRCTKTSGNISLQSEGGPMQFRNIYLETLGN